MAGDTFDVHSHSHNCRPPSGTCLLYEWGYYSQHPAEIFKIWEGGLASHGGTHSQYNRFVPFLVACLKKPASRVFDKIVIAIVLVGGLIRSET